MGNHGASIGTTQGWKIAGTALLTALLLLAVVPQPAAAQEEVGFTLECRTACVIVPVCDPNGLVVVCVSISNAPQGFRTTFDESPQSLHVHLIATSVQVDEDTSVTVPCAKVHGEGVVNVPLTPPTCVGTFVSGQHLVKVSTGVEDPSDPLEANIWLCPARVQVFVGGFGVDTTKEFWPCKFQIP